MTMDYHEINPHEIIRHRDKAVKHYHEEIRKSAFASAAIAAIGPTASAGILVAGGAAALDPVTGPLMLAGAAAASVATGIMKFLDDRKALKKNVDLYDKPMYREIIGEGKSQIAEFNLNKAESILSRMENHPAIRQYQQILKMPERFREQYSETLLRNNPDLASDYKEFKTAINNAQDAMIQAGEKGVFNPQNTSMMKSLVERAIHLPKIDDKADGGLFEKIKSFVSQGFSDNANRQVQKI